MSTDSPTPRRPPRKPRPPRWKFSGADLVRVKLPRSVIVPKGPESHEVSYVVEVRLRGNLDPGDMEFYDSYLPEIRISGTRSSRMVDKNGEYRFTFYPEVDGDLRPGPIEFRARLGDPFEQTGLHATNEHHAAQDGGDQPTAT